MIFAVFLAVIALGGLLLLSVVVLAELGCIYEFDDARSSPNTMGIITAAAVSVGLEHLLGGDGERSAFAPVLGCCHDLMLIRKPLLPSAKTVVGPLQNRTLKDVIDGTLLKT